MLTPGTARIRTATLVTGLPSTQPSGGSSPLPLTASELAALKSTHIIFNQVIRRICEEIDKVRTAPQDSDQTTKLLQSYLRASFCLGTNAADHALTRLFSPEGSDGSDRTELIKARDGFTDKKGKLHAGTVQKIERLPAEMWKTFCHRLKISLPKGLAKDVRETIREALDELGEDRSLANWKKVRRLVEAATISEGRGKSKVEKPLLEQLRTTAHSLWIACKKEQADNLKELEREKQDFNDALTFLDLRRSDFTAPWLDLTVNISVGNGSVAARISTLPSDWQRAVCRQAVEHMKSYYNLGDYEKEQGREFDAMLGVFEANPDYNHYEQAQKLLGLAFGEKSPRDFSPAQLIGILQQHGPALQAWRGDGSEFKIPDGMVEFAKAIKASKPDGLEAGKLRASFWKGLMTVIPEVGTLLEHHMLYTHLKRRKIKPPTLTLPSPYNNPRPVAWSKSQLGFVLWPGESISRVTKDPQTGKKIGGEKITNDSPAHLMIELQQLRVKGNGTFVEYGQRHYLAADERLLALKRKPASQLADERAAAKREAQEQSLPRARQVFEFTEVDPISGRVRAVDIGETKLILVPNDKDREGLGRLREVTPRLTIVVKREAARPIWWNDYFGKNRIIDPRTKEPTLPEKLLVCSFIPDVFGPAEFHVAKATRKGKGYTLQYLRDISGPLSVNKAPPTGRSRGHNLPPRVPTASEINQAKLGAKRLSEEKMKSQAGMLVAKQAMLESVRGTDSSVDKRIGEAQQEFLNLKTAADVVERTRREARAGMLTALAEIDDRAAKEIIFECLRADFRTAQRLAKKAWDRVTNMGEARANDFAGEVVRNIEKARALHPGHEVLVVLEKRFDRTPSKSKFGRMFNRHIANVAGARISNKLQELLSGMDPPVGVLLRSSSGLLAVSPGAEEVNVVQFGVNRKERKVEFLPGPHSAIVRVHDDGGVRARLIPSQELLAKNLIQAAVTPIGWEPEIDKATITGLQHELTSDPAVVAAINKLIFPN